MELTGKCKIEFESWFINWVFKNAMDEYRIPIKERMTLFNLKPESMQYGVYEDFFFSVDIYPIILPIKNDAEERVFQVYNDEDHIITCETASEARQEAIKKANEIYNSKYIVKRNTNNKY